MDRQKLDEICFDQQSTIMSKLDYGTNASITIRRSMFRLVCPMWEALSYNGIMYTKEVLLFAINEKIEFEKKMDMFLVDLTVKELEHLKTLLGD